MQEPKMLGPVLNDIGELPLPSFDKAGQMLESWVKYGMLVICHGWGNNTELKAGRGIYGRP